MADLTSGAAPGDPPPEDTAAGHAPAADPQAADPQVTDPRAADPRAADPRAADPRAADPRAADPRAADPQVTDPTATPAAAAAGQPAGATPLLELRNVSKFFGSVIAVKDISTTVRAGEVTCVLGDNGAGKSTLIKILAGVHQQDEGELLIDGTPTRLTNPRDALDRGIATVYQDLAMIPLMAVWRNFFLGSEPTRGIGPFRWFDVAKAKRVTRAELADMGIDIRDPDQPVGTLSGGERQSVAIARAVHFGARLLILDEPTSALGVKQAGVVLRYIAQARDRGLGVIFITHNPHHAFPVGDRFLLLKRGRSLGDFGRDEISREELTRLMAGGAELDDLAHELRRSGVTEAAAVLQSDARELGV